MLEPVLAADGYTYERATIIAWFEAGHRTSPRPPHRAIEDTSLVPNTRIREATEALGRWRSRHTPGDVRHWLRPAITAPDGHNAPLREPMTLSDGSTVEASALPALFAKHRARSPYTGQFWRRYQEVARPNRALQALSAAIIGFSAPPLPHQAVLPTWVDPVLALPAPSPRRDCTDFCLHYRGFTLPYGLTASHLVGLAAGIVSTTVGHLPCLACFGIGAGACLTSAAGVRAIDYPRYLRAQDEAEQLFQEKCRDAWQIYNVQRAWVGLPPEQPTMTRDLAPPGGPAHG